nr:hypothetical protein [Tanacetum cinerariifolium]
MDRLSAIQKRINISIDFYLLFKIETIQQISKKEFSQLKLDSLAHLAYNDLFVKGRELYLKRHSSLPIFNGERKLVVPSITIAQPGVSNQDYPSKDINMEPITPTLDDLASSLFRVFTGSSKIGTGPGRTDKVRINYYSKNLLIYSHFQEKINEVQMKALVDFEDQFETFSGLLAPLPEDVKQLLC